MLSKYSYKGLTWIDLESPSEEELIHVMEAYDIPIGIGEEIGTPSANPKVDLYQDFISLILHFPGLSRAYNKNNTYEVDFILGTDFMITAHYEPIDPLHEFSRTFEADMILEKEIQIDHAGFLFLRLIQKLYASSRRDLGDIDMRLKEIERKMLEHADMTTGLISDASMILLNTKQILRSHDDVLSSFELPAKKFFGEKFGYYFSTIVSEYAKTRILLDGYAETLETMRAAYNSLVANKTNQAMRALSVAVFIGMPIMGILIIFAMNSGLGSISASIAILLISLISFIYFKFKKWL